MAMAALTNQVVVESKPVKNSSLEYFRVRFDGTAEPNTVHKNPIFDFRKIISNFVEFLHFFTTK